MKLFHLIKNEIFIFYKNRKILNLYKIKVSSNNKKKY